MDTRARHESYSQWLARNIEERGFTIRGLGRAWKPDSPDAGRRSLLRYLNDGVVPQPRIRHELAHTLGTSESGPDGDGSEAD